MARLLSGLDRRQRVAVAAGDGERALEERRRLGVAGGAEVVGAETGQRLAEPRVVGRQLALADLERAAEERPRLIEPRLVVAQAAELVRGLGSLFAGVGRGALAQLERLGEQACRPRDKGRARDRRGPW